jgi:peroxiredoxin
MFKLLFVSLAASVAFAWASEKFEAVPLALGATAPDFRLEGVDGKFYTLDSFKDAKILVVVFTCNHCPDARASRQRINTFAKDYAKKGVSLVAISGNDPKALQAWELGHCVYGDDFESMKAVSKEEGYVYPFLYDGDTQSTTKAYGAEATPHVFLFDKNRKLTYRGRFDNGSRNPGPATENNVVEIVNSMLAGKVIEEKDAITRPFGCSTKWAWKKEMVDKMEAEWKALPVELEELGLEQAKKFAENKTDRIRIINIWSTTCGPCVAEFPDLVDAYRRYQKQNVDLITISVDTKEWGDDVLEFLKEEQLPLSPDGKKAAEAEGRKTNNYQYPDYNLDPLADIIDKKWQGPIPYTCVIAPGGEIVFRHTGKIDPIELRKAVVKLLDAKKNP